MIRLICDFDGTLTRQDSLRDFLLTFARDEWIHLEPQMRSGLLSEREAVKRALVTIDQSIASSTAWAVKHVELDPGVQQFISEIQSRNIPLTILSGGIEQWIRSILTAAELPAIPVIANQLSDAQGRLVLKPAFQAALGCGSCTQCKAAVIQKMRQEFKDDFFVYVGDGFSDRCAVRHVDQVFAKEGLADFCIEKSINHDSFSDVRDLHAQFFKKLRAEPSLREARLYS